MKKIISCCSLLLVTLTGTQAQKNESLNKFSDSIFRSFNNKNSPGCAVTILQNGKPIAQKAYGMASIEHAVPFTHQTVVRMPYSEAREFISIAAVLMQKDRLLSLTDKVRKYFPELPQWADPVTIVDLMNHRSGFVDEWSALLLMHNSMSDRFETDQFLRLLYDQPEPEVEPGRGYQYSNSDFGLLRLIMEKASGQSLAAWMKKRMFDPLKMKSTQMQGNPRDIIPKKAEMYESEGEIYLHINVQKTSPGGNYYILTSAEDLVQWSMAINNNQSEISKASELLLQQVRTIPGKDGHCITGYTIRYINGHRAIFHEGVNEYNYLSHVPSKGLTVITLGNRHGDGFGHENKALVDHLLKVPPPVFPKFLTKPVSITGNELKEYEGRYYWTSNVNWEGPSKPRKFSEVFVTGTKLKMRYRGNYIIELRPVDKDLFYYQEGFGIQVRFSRLDGMVNGVEIEFDDGWKAEKMARDTADEWKPSKEILSGFTGRYYSKHLGYFWNIIQTSSGDLVLKRATLPDAVLRPDGKDQFYYMAEKYPGSVIDQWIRFSKNEEGMITGFTVWSVRIVHHWFDKVK